jgi:hypothetical protein
MPIQEHQNTMKISLDPFNAQINRTGNKSISTQSFSKSTRTAIPCKKYFLICIVVTCESRPLNI